MLKLYTIAVSKRLEYILQALQPALGFEITITADKNSFRNSNEPKINYSPDDFDDKAVWIKPHALIFEKDIRTQEIQVQQKENTPFFFLTAGVLGFDLFSAAFYLLSRYEEYLSHTKDEFGLYSYKNSIACKNNFLEKPIIHDWCNWLRTELKQKFPDFKPGKTVFSFLPTYDIDIAYQYKHHSSYKNAGGFIKDFITLQFNNIQSRVKVLSDKLPDAFDNYDWLFKLHKQMPVQPVYFFLVADKRSKYDKNISPASLRMQSLIKRISKQANIGLHPSWQSSKAIAILEKEKNMLASISAERITKSRQHYIQLNFPTTYQQLIQIGITEDYSMGYPAKNGFRASYAFPFFWYDLSKEEQTNLRIYPFCFMDASAIFGEQLKAEEFAASLYYYCKLLQEKGGQMITVFHNHFLIKRTIKKVYQTFVSSMKYQ